MGLIDRIYRVVRANINSLVSQTEDPEKILLQAVSEMQDDLIQLRQASSGAIATQKRTERQSRQNQATEEEWYRRAQLALQQNQEDLARVALTKRKFYQETASALQAQLIQQNSIVTRLKQDMRTLESKISEAKTKKDMYIARARSAEATQRLNEMLGNVRTGNTLGAMERRSEKVMQLEAQYDAIASLRDENLTKTDLRRTEPHP